MAELSTVQQSIFFCFWHFNVPRIHYNLKNNQVILQIIHGCLFFSFSWTFPYFNKPWIGNRHFQCPVDLRFFARTYCKIQTGFKPLQQLPFTANTNRLNPTKPFAVAEPNPLEEQHGSQSKTLQNRTGTALMVQQPPPPAPLESAARGIKHCRTQSARGAARQPVENAAEPLWGFSNLPRATWRRR